MGESRLSEINLKKEMRIAYANIIKRKMMRIKVVIKSTQIKAANKDYIS